MPQLSRYELLEQERITQQIAEEQQTFRNELASLNVDGTRKWIYPQETQGRYTAARNIVAYILLGFLCAAPFIRVYDNPLIMLNILERKFIVFGVVFWPQDFYLVVLGLLTFILGIAVFTSILGRIWCGWTCPQTIFLEFVFRRIERWIEGNARQRIAFDKAPMNLRKLARKALKHSVFFVLSWILCNVFLAYIIGVEELFRIITEPPSQHIGGLTAMVVCSGLFYGVFARFREQACFIACPYGRFMSALVYPETLAVTYDFKRGEPRRRPSRADKQETITEPRGDCIDCGQCVSVCPTGIDIRNGIQLECVNCTACIDACDSVMRKIRKPIGLIRYASLQAIQQGRSSYLTPRVKGYVAILLVMITVFTALFLRRPQTEAVVLRQPGTLFQRVADDKIANFYTVQVINKTFQPKTLEVRIVEPQQATLIALTDNRTVPAQHVWHGRFLIVLPATVLYNPSTTITLAVLTDATLVKEVKTTFVAPVQ
ncbi:MAG: cytochrome c oxidase accessory protein CcoG [Candidatus Kapabacteria bacterium]|nr:cytochrome c oxidase accessory protein CcoG [Candidatus Kapabacteria bacterium]